MSSDNRFLSWEEMAIDPWVSDFVHSLFLQRGHKGDEARLIIANQWPNWKRLMIESGLSLDRNAAYETSYQFAYVEVKGGIGKIFEVFAKFVDNKPKPVRELEESRFSGETQGCELCEGQGVIMAEVVNREGRIKNAAFGCSCERGRTIYGGIPQATPEILEWRRSQVRTEKTLAMEYLKNVGCDPYSRIGFSEFNKMIQEVARIDRKHGKNQLSGYRSIDLPSNNQSSVIRNSRVVSRKVENRPSEDELALAVFENGDERGWVE